MAATGRKTGKKRAEVSIHSALAKEPQGSPLNAYEDRKEMRRERGMILGKESKKKNIHKTAKRGKERERRQRDSCRD